METGDKNRNDFHCMEMSLVMRMRFIFGDDWNDACKARFRRRTFHEPNLIRIKTDPNYLDRAKLIQTPILFQPN